VPRRNRGDELGALALAYNLETQRRSLTERQLSAEEQKHSALFETSDISQWLVDFSAVDLLLQQLRRDGVTNLAEHLEQHPKLISELIVKIRVSSVNNATLRMFTTNRSSDYVQTLGGILAEEMRSFLSDLLIAVWQGQGSFAEETSLRSQDNRQFPAIITIPLPPAGNSMQVRTMSIVDISMLQNHAGDYSLQNEILNALEDGICTVRLADTSILTVNPAFERLFLHSASKLQGQPLLLLSVKTAEARDGQVQNLASVIKAEKDWGGLVQCQRRDGVEFTCHVQVSSHFHVDHGALAILSFRPAQVDGSSA
jgi:PAS domain S-box-containing protein